MSSNVLVMRLCRHGLEAQQAGAENLGGNGFGVNNSIM